jgi:hypothetical protein
VVMLIAFMPPDSGIFRGSRTMKYIRPMADIVSRLAPGNIRTRYDKNERRMGRRGTLQSVFRPIRRGETGSGASRTTGTHVLSAFGGSGPPPQVQVAFPAREMYLCTV